MSQQQLAERAHTTPAQISRLENGSRRLDMDWIARLAQALDVSTAQIMGLAPLDFIEDVQAEAAMIPISLLAGVVRQRGQVIAAEPGSLEGFHAAGIVRDARALAALQVEGGALGPFLPDGSILYYGNRVFGVPKAYFGLLCVVKLVENSKNTPEIGVYRVYEGKKAGYYRLESPGKAISGLEEALVEWSAPVCWVKFPQ